MPNNDFTRKTPDGNPTERELAIDSLYDALDPVLPHPFSVPTQSSDQDKLSKAVLRFTEEYGRRATAEMIKNVEEIISLTLRIAGDVSHD